MSIRASTLLASGLATLLALGADLHSQPGVIPPPGTGIPISGPGFQVRSPGRFRIHPAHAVRVESTKVTAKLVDGIATTKVKFRLRNLTRREAEKILILPIPKGASADGLELWIGGKPTKGEVLDKDKARGIYQAIVASRQDPALLEYVDRSTLRLRVFPIPAQGTQDVEVRYRMLMPNDAGMRRWEFPCRALESGRFSIDLELDSKKAIKNVWSPMQGIDISRKGDHKARASYESAGRPTRDPVIFYGLSDRDFGLDLLTYREGQRGDGYFVALVAPKRDWKNEKELRKSIHFVVDTSGSMSGPKIEQARGALRFFLNSLRPNDRFNVVPFSTEARPFYPKPVEASEDNIAGALEQAKALEARGGTNIGEALTHALAASREDGCVPIVVFLTDGRATVGMTGEKDLLAACKRANKEAARVFVFGVGHDVNTKLLDTIANETRGSRDYVQPRENLEVKVSALFEKLAYPVMTDLEIVADGVTLERMIPKRIPDMFRGSHLVITGRYKGKGSVALRLKGRIGNDAKEFIYDASFPETAAENDFVATLWAQRRIGQLVDVLRLKGQNAELLGEVKRLGKEHGIVTPWTSQLVVEEGMRLARAGAQFDSAIRGAADRVPAQNIRIGRVATAAKPSSGGGGRARAGAGGPSTPGPGGPSTPGAKHEVKEVNMFSVAASGEKAVLASTLSDALKKRSALRDRSKDKAGARSQRIGKRVFHEIAGIWVDSKLTGALAKDPKKITAFSKEYFELLQKDKSLAKVFAFAVQIVVVVDGVAIQITPPVKKAAPTKRAPETKKN